MNFLNLMKIFMGIKPPRINSHNRKSHNCVSHCVLTGYVFGSVADWHKPGPGPNNTFVISVITVDCKIRCKNADSESQLNPKCVPPF